MLKPAGEPTPQLQTCVIWRRILDDASDEFCDVRQQNHEAEVEGVLVGLTRGCEPFSCSYQILANSALSQARRLVVRYRSPLGTRSLSVARSRSGWEIAGDEPAFIEADEIDLEWSPLTNMFPIRRMLEQSLETLEIMAAWVRVPDLRIERSAQRYDQVDARTVRYTSVASGFTALISHDGEGFPLDYQGVWKQRSYWSSAA